MHNKDRAFELLRAKLLAVREEEQKAKIAELKGEVVSASWGNAIRSYVLDEGQLKMFEPNMRLEPQEMYSMGK